MNRRDFIQSSIAAALALAVGCGKQESASGSGGSGVASGKGSVRDSSGRPIAGVAVTDGFSVVKTDSDGRFSLDLHKNAEFVYLCVPAAYEIPYGLDGYPAFFKRLRTAPDLDFTLTPLPGGPQTKWNFLVVSDIHGNTSEAGGVPFAKLDRVVVPDIAASVGDYDNLYSVILGDIMTAASDNNWGYMYGKVKHSVSGAHFFMVPGNHDWWTSSQDTEPSIKHFTRRFGPTRWSFDRGDVHIVGMNNILTSGLKADGEMMTGANNDYQAGFTDEEFEWLRQDLSMVDKSKMVILCVHVPFGDGDNHSTGRARHVAYHDETVKLLSGFASARIFSGHSHRNIRYAIGGGENPSSRQCTPESSPITHITPASAPTVRRPAISTTVSTVQPSAMSVSRPSAENRSCACTTAMPRYQAHTTAPIPGNWKKAGSWPMCSLSTVSRQDGR